MRAADQFLGDFPLQSRQADVETGREAVNAMRYAQVHFDINGHVGWERDLLLPRDNLDR